MLIRGFNEMLVQIRNRDAELESNRIHLEELVDHRTQQLQTMNEQLQRELAERTLIEEELRVAKTSGRIGQSREERVPRQHEPRDQNPMNGITGMTELALGTDLSPEQRDYLLAVKNCGDSLLGILNDILDFSKIEAKKLVLDQIPIELSETIFRAARMLAPQAHGKGLELLCDISPDAPDRVVGDPMRLRQIIVNLLANAVKFTEGGEIVVKVEVDSISQGEALLHFSVSDTGIGIPLDKRDTIFRAFEQADGSMSRKYGGTGLGLAISSQLVHLMGGRIWIESEVGQGSTIHFTAKFGLSQSGATGAGSADLRNRQVLVVDDNATSRRIIKRDLTHHGMRPTVVASGGEAIAAIRNAANGGERFELVITNSRPPDIDGFALAEDIRRDPASGKPAVIVLMPTGHKSDLHDAKSSCVLARLLKPASQSELLDAMSAVLGGRVPSSASSSIQTCPSVSASSRKLRILLAEDNVVNQKLASRILEKWGHGVVVVGDGKSAVAALEHNRFDLILMDVQMPEMDGLEATALIRENEKATGGHIPIVAMTAHAMIGDRERCIESGMDAYVSKPIQNAELMRVIESSTKPDSAESGEQEAA